MSLLSIFRSLQAPAPLAQPTEPPRFMFVDTNLQCNLKCKTCHFWAREEVVLPGHISIARRSEIIAEFAELNPQGTIVICGGEALMNPERYFPITRQCRELGLQCLSVMNGTKVTDDASAEQLMREGPTEITVSLNSYQAAVHDRTRGMIGSWDLATGAIRRLLAARERLGASTKVFAMSVMCEQNYRDLAAFYDFVLNDLRADKLKLNFLQPTFGPIESMEEDKFYRDNIIADYDGLCRILEACDKKFGLNLNPDWVEVVRLYHRSVHTNADAGDGWAGKGTEKPICNSYERNIMLDMSGVARLCFSTGFPGTKLKARGDLRKFWYGNDALRARMALCTQYCGISHSVRRTSATLKNIEPPATKAVA